MENRARDRYRLAVYLAPWMTRRELDDALGDYDEYVDRTPPILRSPPRDYGSDMLAHRLRRVPATPALLALASVLLLIAAAALLSRRGGTAEWIGLCAAAVGLPPALWVLQGGSAAAAYAPRDGADRVMLMVTLAVAILALAAFQTWVRLLRGAIQLSLPAWYLGAALRGVLRAAQVVCLVLLVHGVRKTLRNSAFYLCLEAQAVALFLLFQGMLRALTGTAPAVNPLWSLAPFLLGWFTSAVLWFLLRRAAGKRNREGKTL